MPKLDVIPLGTVFGRLTLLSKLPRQNTKRVIRCICSCGNNTNVLWQSIKHGKTISCGCFNKEKDFIHGESHTRLHEIWSNMIHRCESPSNSKYEYYGGRGISVCLPRQTYENFRDWALANGYKDNLTIDRNDTNVGYHPDNCSWQTRSTQAANRNKRKNTKNNYIGVNYSRHNYTASVCHQGKRVYIGSFSEEKCAAVARDDYIKRHNLPHKLNF